LFQEDLYPDTAAQEAAISAEDWFAGRDADPVIMSLREVFLASQPGKEPGKGGSVLRQASRRIGGNLNNNNNQTNDNKRDSTVINGDSNSSSMSRLSVKPASHEPSPQPQSNQNQTTTTNASYSVSQFLILNLNC
jgi:hypothetical protein